RVGEHPDDRHRVDVEDAIAHGEGADAAQHDDDDGHQPRRHPQDVDEEPDAEQLGDEDHQIGHHDRDVDAVDFGLVGQEQRRSGHQAVDHHAGQDDGGGGVPRNAERQERDHGPAGHGVVGGL